ncbi:MAG TPA: DNRLRE domain-containing protein, partial [Anaerolineae bacterium]|nr:DNRLRE domain-containing protein [Anaerolineae bacterium]
LLAIVYDNEFPNQVTFQAQVVACENTLEVVRYPLDGECIELHRPPSPIPAGQLHTVGNVRIYSPAGFDSNCAGVCTTKDTLSNGKKVAAMVGSTTDDNRWVALKGGTLTISGGNIQTSPDVRLVMADFGLGAGPVTLPVLRGRYAVNASSGLMTRISAPNDTYLLVKSPLPEQDLVSGWEYEVALLEARMRARGQVSRSIEATESDPTDFGFNASWSITARGGVDLTGGASVQSISQTQFSVGTLLVTPPTGADYTMEHNPLNADANLPAVMPLFEHIRMTGAILSQPATLGGAQVPVQALILPPKQSVYEPASGGPEQVDLHCGDSCFDLRGEADTMTSSEPYIVREYRMPDLIIQDQAGTVMLNTEQGVEIYSRDHPLSRLGTSGSDYSFSYEAFGGSIRTYEGECPKPRDPLNPSPPPSNPPGPTTTILVGTATMSLPNAESEEGGPAISVSFTLCGDSLREMSFSFSTGDQTAIPMGNSGIFMNYVGGTISLAEGQGPQPGYTTVVLEVQLRGMSAQAASSNVFVKGVVTIDSRGLFDMQLQAGIEVFAGIGVGADGHFWVAWAPLDLGFEVQACVPYDEGFQPAKWPKYGHRCAGNEILTGSLRAHLWQGQGWQNQYHWLPDNDDLHIAARYEVSINIPEGILVDWELFVLPPEDIQLYGIKLAFGEFCTNNACTGYEWGAMGAYVLLGYDIGFYYGFDSGLDFILGSADYVLIDEAGQVYSSANQVVPRWRQPDLSSYTITVPPGVPSAMFGLGWDPGMAATDMDLSLQTPDGTIVDRNSGFPWATATVSPTGKGWQTIIVVENPDAGDWEVNITSDGDQLPDHNFVYFANNPVPSLTLDGFPEPSQDHLEPGDTVEIEWTSNVSDTLNSWLSLYYTVTNPVMTMTQEIAGPIVERLPLTSHGTYKWHVQGLAYVDDVYHVYARIDSNVASVVNGCGKEHKYNPDPTANVSGCGTMLNPGLVLPAAEIVGLAEFWYEDWVPPATPILLSAAPADWTNVEVLWQPNSEVDLAGYLVRCAQGPLVRTVRTAAVHTGDAMLQEAALVNGLHPEQAATCSLRAYDTSGNISGHSNSAVVWPENPITQVIIEPLGGGVVLSPNGGIKVTFPPGAVEKITLVKYTQQPAPPHPIGPLKYAGTSFDLSAFGPSGEPVQQFLTDLELVILYEDQDWQQAGIAGEESLGLYRWDGTAWQGVLPCEGCMHDLMGNRFTVLLDHLSEFALMGAAEVRSSLYLPLLMVRRGSSDPTRTPTATVRASDTPTRMPTATATATPTRPPVTTATPTATPIPTATATLSATPTPSPTATPTSTPAPITLSLAPVADAYILSAVPRNNYGTADRLSVGRQSGRSLTRSLLRFDLRGIPAGATIQRATLRCYLVQSSTSPRLLDIALKRIDTDWEEDTVTWDTPLGYADLDIAAEVGTAAVYYEWDATGLVWGWLSGGTGSNHGMALWSEDEAAEGWRSFTSRENTYVPPLTPLLDVIYIP